MGNKTRGWTGVPIYCQYGGCSQTPMQFVYKQVAFCHCSFPFLLLPPGAGNFKCFTDLIDPLPMIIRNISGKNKITTVTQSSAAMLRNQKNQGQLAAYIIRVPPIMGPMLSAIVILSTH